MDSVLAVRLKPGEERRLLSGHPWVFSNEIDRIEGAPAAAGDLVEVVSASGRSLGNAFYHPNSLIACRLVARQGEGVDVEFFKRRLGAALQRREAWLPGAKDYRLCFGESDGLPGLVADRYGDYVVLQILAAGMERRLEMIADALDALIAPKGIYLKNDHRARALEGLPLECRSLRGSEPGRVTVVENGVKFAADLGEGQKTGFYFDQRDNRAFVAPYCKGRQVLDLYCYTGGFALNAAKAGATNVLGVDSSAAAIELARAGAELNGVEANFEEGDAEQALQDFAGASEASRPGLIVLDPPSFVPSKKHLPKALRAYAKLNALALKALPPGGMLATATCSHHVSREAFVTMLRESASRLQKTVRLVALRGQAVDHPVILSMPETEYLHFALLEVG